MNRCPILKWEGGIGMKKLWISLGILVILVQAIPSLAADQQEPVAERYKECYSDDEKQIYFDTETLQSTMGGDNEYIDVWFKYVYTPKGVIACEELFR